MADFKNKKLFLSILMLVFLSGWIVSTEATRLAEKIEPLEFERELTEKMNLTLTAKGQGIGQFPNASLLEVIRKELRLRNANIENVYILDMRPIGYASPKHLVLGRGTPQKPDFRGSFDDELFGLFIVDANLNRIEKTMDILPTPCWFGTEMRIERLDSEYAVIIGKRMDYGYRLLHRRYEIRNLAD